MATVLGMPRTAAPRAAAATATGQPAACAERRKGLDSSWAVRILAVVVLVVVVAAAVRMRTTLAEALTALRALGPVPLAVVLAGTGVVVVLRGLVQRRCIPGATLGEGVVLDQVNLAVMNCVPGGALVGAGARYRVGRSFGHGADAMALSLVASNQAMSVARWCLVAAVAAGSLLAGTGSGVEVAVLGSAVAALAVSATVCWVVVRDTKPTRAAVRLAQWVADRAALRVARARDVDVAGFVGRVRERAGGLLRERGLGLVLLGAATVLVESLLLALLVTALGHGGPGVLDVVRIHLMVRVAAGLAPTPGNVGVLEGALVAGLVAAGTEPAVAVGAVMAFRGLTFVLPVLTGGTVYLTWRRWDRRRTTAPAATLPVVGPLVDPVLAALPPAGLPVTAVPPVATVGLLGHTGLHGASAGNG